MSESEKRGGPGGGGAGKKIRIGGEEKRFAKPISAQPRKPKMQQYEEILDEPEPVTTKKQKRITEVAIVPAKRETERKYVTSKTLGKFAKSKVRRLGQVVEIPAAPIQPLDGDHEMVPRRQWAAQGRQLLSSAASAASSRFTDVREQSLLRMREVLNHLRGRVVATPTGLIMNRMLQQVRQRRPNTRGNRALGDRRYPRNPRKKD
jgi:hypothetical protein